LRARRSGVILLCVDELDAGEIHHVGRGGHGTAFNRRGRGRESAGLVVERDRAACTLAHTRSSRDCLAGPERTSPPRPEEFPARWRAGRSRSWLYEANARPARAGGHECGPPPGRRGPPTVVAAEGRPPIPVLRAGLGILAPVALELPAQGQRRLQSASSGNEQSTAGRAPSTTSACRRWAGKVAAPAGPECSRRAASAGPGHRPDPGGRRAFGERAWSLRRRRPGGRAGRWRAPPSRRARLRGPPLEP